MRVLLGLLIGVIFGIPAASGQTPSPEAACRALTSPENAAKFAALPDAVTTINSARIVAAGGRGTVADDDLPEICRVEGYITPTVGFLVRMPTTSWNGKFMMGGCGGPCGNYLEDRIDPALVRNYAVVTTDMGHKGVGWAWAYNNVQGQIDFAYRATHLTAVVAKEVIATFYGRPATRNYYLGCSTGGRQGMILAQRFPTDFEGIVAGAPVFNQLGDSPYFLDWAVKSNTAADFQPILTPEHLPIVHQAVLAACDAKDGLADGILQNPLACAWDPKEIICKSGQSGACLTAAQADVVRKIYDGARNSKGGQLYWGMPRGSEDQWAVWLRPRPNQGTSITAHLGFAPSAPLDWTVYDFDYDRDPARLAMNSVLQSPLNPDLTAFKKAGGRLILFHGANDSSIPYEASIDYYERVVKTMGGRKETDPFFRLFTPPAMNHCRGGDGGGAIDWITALENWIEKGEAPEALLVYHPNKPYPSVARDITDYGGSYSKYDRFPMNEADYDRVRPLYPYPAYAKYAKGDPAKASSYSRAMP